MFLFEYSLDVPRPRDTWLKQRHLVYRRAGAADHAKGIDGQHELVAVLFGAGFGQGSDQGIVPQANAIGKARAGKWYCPNLLGEDVYGLWSPISSLCAGQRAVAFDYEFAKVFRTFVLPWSNLLEYHHHVQTLGV